MVGEGGGSDVTGDVGVIGGSDRTGEVSTCSLTSAPGKGKRSPQEKEKKWNEVVTVGKEATPHGNGNTDRTRWHRLFCSGVLGFFS